MCGYFSPTQSNRDRFVVPLPFLALGAEMNAPSAAVERDALARCDICAGTFACQFVRHFLRRGQAFFASCDVASSFPPTMGRLPSCA